MKFIYRCFLFSVLFLLFCTGQVFPKPTIELDVDWENFMSEQDMLWDCMPQKWTEAPFMGNGLIGSMIFQKDENHIIWQVGRSDVCDHREAAGKYESRTGMADNARLPIGYFTLETEGKIEDADLRLGLYNAETTGTISTTKGTIKFQTLVHSEKLLIFVDLKFSKDESGCRWKWHPQKAQSPRYTNFLGTDREIKNYKLNPESRLKKINGVNLCVQSLLAGGQTATAWKETEPAKNRKRLYISVEHSFPESTAESVVLENIKTSVKVPVSQLLKTHRLWWHNFYSKSFLSIPDKRLESFYWIQLYKLASATRSNRAIIDNCGPWLQPTNWPGCWWNLNVQLSYSAALPSNHPELASSLINNLYKNYDNLIKAVPERFRYNSAALPRASGQDMVGEIRDPKIRDDAELGNLTWVMHNCYMQYLYTMDEELLRQKIYPILKRAVNLYLHLLYEGNDGKLHLVSTLSPEYGTTEDANFDLSLLRWGCKTLIDISNKLDIDKKMNPKWEKVLADLTEYPSDETGFMIGKDTPYAKSHRHYSHLLMIYPLYLVNYEQPENIKIIKKSISHWLSKPKMLKGYSYTGSSSMYSSLADGDKAISCLNGLFDKFLQPNTMYFESGGPVIETPLAGARSILDMLIQSWGGKIRVFPAVPSIWKDVAFYDLRTQSSFLISAVRENGKTKWIRIRSLAGEPCIIKTDINDPIVDSSDKVSLKRVSEDEFELDLNKNQSVFLRSAKEKPVFAVSPAGKAHDDKNYFGINNKK